MNTLSSLLKNLRNRTPVGTIQMYGGSTPPEDWLLCDGSAVSRETFSSLFEKIGTTYGAGDGSTTFNLPDLKGKMPLGVSTSHEIGSTGGSEYIQAHTHGFTNPTYAVNNNGKVTNGITGGSHDHDLRTYAASGTAGTGYAYQPSESGKYNRNGDWVYTSTHTHDLPNHSHTVSRTAAGTVNAVSGATTGNAGNMPPFCTINFIIYAGTSAS